MISSALSEIAANKVVNFSPKECDKGSLYTLFADTFKHDALL